MSDACVAVWATKTAHGFSTMTKLCSLPPTTEAFTENVKRAPYQAALWRHAEDPSPPALDASKYGWERDTDNKSLTAVTIPSNLSIAPEFILKLLKCSYKSNKPCSSARCTCYAAGLSCTVFRSCHNAQCLNPKSKQLN